MTLVSDFLNRLRCIGTNDGVPRLKAQHRMEHDASECLRRILGMLRDLSEPIRRETAKAILAMARNEHGEFMGVGDADPHALRELIYGLVVLEEGGKRRGGPTFRMPHSRLREEIRGMSVDDLVALARPRRW